MPPPPQHYHWVGGGCPPPPYLPLGAVPAVHSYVPLVIFKSESRGILGHPIQPHPLLLGVNLDVDVPGHLA